MSAFNGTTLVVRMEGFWEKGMTSLPMVAYLMNDSTTHDKVLQHFSITLK